MCTVGTTSAQQTVATTPANGGPAVTNAPAPTPTQTTPPPAKLPPATQTTQAVAGATGAATASGPGAAVTGAAQLPGADQLLSQLKTLLEQLTQLLSQLSPQANGGPTQSGCGMMKDVAMDTAGAPAQANGGANLTALNEVANQVANAARILASTSSSSSSQSAAPPAAQAPGGAFYTPLSGQGQAASDPSVALGASFSGSNENENGGTGIFGGTDATGSATPLPGLGSALPGSVMPVVNFFADPNENAGSFI